MLVLSRKLGEKVIIGDVTLTVVGVRGHQVRLAFDALEHVRILRSELLDRKACPHATYAEFDADLPEKPGE
jgi:carbon storage regulator